MPQELQPVISKLDSLRHLSGSDNEYWLAREIMPVLGYSSWQNFESVIEKARAAIKGMGYDPNYQVIDVSNMIEVGKGAKRPMKDYALSRYACYLIAMNGDSNKQEVAIAQNYFAVQTRRMELNDAKSDVERRLEMRNKVKAANKELSSVAKGTGVINFGAFYDAGYRGLYNMPLSQLKEKKQIGKDDLLDRAGHAELAAFYFKSTQTEQKISRENIQGEKAAIDTHREVGEKVRQTIKSIGGTMPEDLPAEEPIRQLEKEQKKKLIKK